MPSKSFKKPTISVFIAALNEEKIIGRTVRECLKLKNYNVKVFVVLDSKTKDKTSETAKKSGAAVIDTGRWMGKGAALRKASKHAVGDYVVQIDADMQFLPSEIPLLVEALIGGYDVALGTRYRRGANVESGSVTNFRHFGIYFLSLTTSIFIGQRVTDVLAGFKAFKSSVYKKVEMKEDHYGYEAEVVIKAKKKGYKIIDIPISYRKRSHGNSNVIPIKHGFMFLWSIIKISLFS